MKVVGYGRCSTAEQAAKGAASRSSARVQPQFLGSGVCGRSAQSPGVQTFLPSRQQLTELLDCRQLARTDLIVLAVRGFGDPLSDGDEPFVHLGALIRRQ
jgi:hypothetical protein